MQIGQVTHKGSGKGDQSGKGGRGRGRGKGRGRGRFNKYWKPYSYQGSKGKGKGSKGKGKGKGFNSGFNSGYSSGYGSKGGSKGSGKYGSKGSGKSSVTCYTCGKRGHTSSQCYSNQGAQPMVQQVHQEQMYYQLVPSSPFISGPSTVYQSPPGLAVPSSSASMASTTRLPQGSNGGHRVQTVQQVQQQGHNFGWVLTFSQEHFVPSHRIPWDVNKFMLVDSGASLHVCPPHFAVQFPIKPHPNPPVIRGVNNKVLQILGIKTVRFKMSNDVSASADFVVTHCNHAILSATALADKGFDVVFSSQGASISKDNVRLPLHRFEQLYFLCPEILDDVVQSISSNDLRIMTVVDHSKGNDFWEILQDQGLLIRHHKRSRKAMFFPKMTSDIPLDVSLLLPTRTTHVNNSEGNSIIQDDWTNPSEQSKTLQFAWTGKTVFTLASTSPPTSLETTVPEAVAVPPVQHSSSSVDHQIIAHPSLIQDQLKLAQERPSGNPSLIPSDHWDKRGRAWVRFHVQARTSFFIPTSGPGGPNPDQLTGIRVTRADFEDGTSDTFVHEWRSPEDLPDFSQKPWTGVSTFIELPQPNLQGNSFKALAVPDDGQLDQSASVQPKQLPVPDSPSEMEIRTHNLTHLPFRAWCPHCVQGKGKAAQHRTLSERSPVIQVDYGFLTVPDSKEQVTVMTAIDIITGLATASVVTSKGANLHAVTELKRFILETGRSFAFLQSDQEPSIKAVLQAVIKQLPGLTLRGAPTHSSASQGSVERYHQTLFSQIRTIKLQIETEYKIQMKLDSVLLPWMVRHSAWLLNGFLIHSDGLTS